MQIDKRYEEHQTNFKSMIKAKRPNEIDFAENIDEPMGNMDETVAYFKEHMSKNAIGNLFINLFAKEKTNKEKVSIPLLTSIKYRKIDNQFEVYNGYGTEPAVVTDKINNTHLRGKWTIFYDDHQELNHTFSSFLYNTEKDLIIVSDHSAESEIYPKMEQFITGNIDVTRLYYFVQTKHIKCFFTFCQISPFENFRNFQNFAFQNF